MIAFGSIKTFIAVSKPIPCFRRFARFLFASHVNRVATYIQYSTYTEADASTIPARPGP